MKKEEGEGYLRESCEHEHSSMFTDTSGTIADGTGEGFDKHGQEVGEGGEEARLTRVDGQDLHLQGGRETHITQIGGSILVEELEAHISTNSRHPDGDDRTIANDGRVRHRLPSRPLALAHGDLPQLLVTHMSERVFFMGRREPVHEGLVDVEVEEETVGDESEQSEEIVEGGPAEFRHTEGACHGHREDRPELVVTRQNGDVRRGSLQSRPAFPLFETRRTCH